MGSRKALVRPVSPSLKKLVVEQFRQKKLTSTLVDQGRVHVSSLGDLCPRAEVLAVWLRIERPDDIDSDLNLTFSHGSGMHWAMQNEVLPALCEGKLFIGQWQCLRCGYHVGAPHDLFSRPKSCFKCGAEDKRHPPFQYIETRVEDLDYKISGRLDGFLQIPDREDVGVFEAKSISTIRAKDVKDVPDMSHVIQLQAYLWLTNLQWGIILYWDKGTFRNPLIEHFIERDEDTIEQIKLMLRGLWSGIETGVLPERFCSSTDCKRAEACPLAKQCFEHEDKIK